MTRRKLVVAGLATGLVLAGAKAIVAGAQGDVPTRDEALERHSPSRSTVYMYDENGPPGPLS